MTITHPETLGLAYLATPYSKYKGGNLALAFVEAARLAAKLLQSGVKVYSPITHTHGIAIYGGIDPLDHSIWLPFDQAMMAVADVLIVAHMDGWEQSYGVGEEIKFFESAGKPIFDLDPVTLLMTRRKTGGVPRLEELRSILANPKPAVTIESAMARIEAIDKEIAKDLQWGAVHSAMSGERKELVRFIARQTPPLSYKIAPSQQGG